MKKKKKKNCKLVYEFWKILDPICRSDEKDIWHVRIIESKEEKSVDRNISFYMYIKNRVRIPNTLLIYFKDR
jgi:hypothetical protein